MRARSLLHVAWLWLLLFPGCNLIYTTPVRPFVGGAIYTGYSAPLLTNFDKTPAKPTKVGRASTKYIFIPLPFIGGIDFAFDKASVEQAAKAGGITKVYYADHSFTSVLCFYGSYETIVYGE
jgi:hypothetical protein